MKPAVSLLLGCALSLGVTRPAHGVDVWARAAGRSLLAERELQRALYRTQEGTSDELDMLLVRTAMIDAARGKRYELGLTTVQVIRTRRLLGLPRAQGDVALLRSVIDGPSDAETTALAALELGRLLRLAGEPEAAELELDRALGAAWRSETRVEAHLMRGWLAVEREQPRAAQAEFRAALAFELGRAQLVLALSSLAHAQLLAGDFGAARRHFLRARAIASSGETVSQVVPSERPELLPADRAALEALEQRVRASAADGDEDDLDP